MHDSTQNRKADLVNARRPGYRIIPVAPSVGTGRSYAKLYTLICALLISLVQWSELRYIITVFFEI